MTIDHPILADFEITDVVVENVIQPVQTDSGEWMIEIRFIEYHEPVVALEQPRSNQNAPHSALRDPREIEIEENSRLIALLEMANGRASQ